MSNSINEIRIYRYSIDHHYEWLFIEIADGDDVTDNVGVDYATNNNEDEAVIQVFDEFVEHFQLNYLPNTSLEQLKLNIIQGFDQLRQNDLSGNSLETMIVDLPQEQLELHFSCKMGNNEAFNTQESGENNISQSGLKQKLSNVEKDGRVLKFFEDNKCSVCLSSYKEILDDNLHIVIPTCGHPLCCQCADNILVKGKKECPRCRGKLTADSFNLMKFNTDLRMVTQDQRVFL